MVRNLSPRSVLFVCLLVSVVSAQGATRTWSGAVSESWSDSANWLEGAVPAAGDVLVFPSGARERSVNDLPETAYDSLKVSGRTTINSDPGNPITVTNGVMVTGGATFFVDGLRAPMTQWWSCNGNCFFRRAVIEATITTFTNDSIVVSDPSGAGMISLSGGRLHLSESLAPAGTFDGTVVLNDGLLIVSGAHPAVDVQAGPMVGIINLVGAQLRSLQALSGAILAGYRSDVRTGDLRLGPRTTAIARSFIVSGSVALDGGTLRIAPTGWPDVLADPGTVYTYIDNDGTNAVYGTFAGLPEGATLRAVSGQRFAISYTGGDGNDVTLTALAHYSAPADFDNDGRSEVLWRHGGNGENYRWIMDGPARTGAAVVNSVADAQWQIAATADFDGDGDSDVFWRHAVTGENYMYRMEGGAIAEAGHVNFVKDPDWKVAAAGDLNGDGKADVLWRNDVTDETYVYLMNGRFIEQRRQLRGAGAGWKVAGIADVDLDSRADILWNHTVTGEIYVWYMNGFIELRQQSLGTFPAEVVAGIGTFDSDDRRPDVILWNEQQRQFHVYLLQTEEVPTSYDPLYAAGDVDAGWSIAAVGDYNGDSITDVLWRHAVTGENYLYTFKAPGQIGPPYRGDTLPEVADFGWQIVR